MSDAGPGYVGTTFGDEIGSAIARDIPLDIASDIARAATLLGGARQPAIGGLGTDVAGLRAALSLASRIGAIVDHGAGAHGRVALASIAGAGLRMTTAAEARHRGDLLVLAGPGAVRWTNRSAVFETRDGDLYPWRGPRSVLCLASGGERPSHLAIDGDLAVVGDDIGIDRVLGVIAARLAGRPLADPRALPGIDTIVELLAAARFGVAIADPEDFDAVSFERLTRLVSTLDREDHRFTTLITPALHHGRGAHHVALWTTGRRLPVGFGRGPVEQDDWRFDIERAVEAGEVDALLWIGALGPELPAYAAGVPTVALLRHGSPATDAEVAIEVGVPGITHPGVLSDTVRDGFAFVDARAPQALPSVGAVLRAMETTLAKGALKEDGG